MNHPYVVSLLQEVGGKTVTQGIYGGLLGDPCLRESHFECLL